MMSQSDDVKTYIRFEVEKVIGISSEGNVRSYKVQWAPAWVSGPQLVGCEHLIQEFLQKQKGDEENDGLGKLGVLERLVTSPSGSSDNVDQFDTSFIFDDLPSNSPGTQMTETGLDSDIVVLKHGMLPQVEEKVVGDKNVANKSDDDNNEDYGTEEGEDGRSSTPYEKRCQYRINATENDITGSDDPCDVGASVSIFDDNQVSRNCKISLKNDHVVETGQSDHISFFIKTEESDDDFPLILVPTEEGSYHVSQGDVSGRPQPESGVSTNRVDPNDREGKEPSGIGKVIEVVEDDLEDGDSEAEDSSLEERMKSCHQCEHCEKTYSKRSHLKRHLKTHSNDRPYQCQHCHKTFIRSDVLLEHTRIHMKDNIHKCTYCAKTFSSKEKLDQHVSEHHVDRMLNTMLLKCEKCKSMFANRDDLNEHMQLHRAESSSTRNNRHNKCDHCGESFGTKFSLKRHQERHTNEKREFKCDHCNKIFTRKFALDRHLRSHLNEKPYPCKYCSKSFSRNSILLKHLQLHGKEKKDMDVVKESE